MTGKDFALEELAPMKAAWLPGSAIQAYKWESDISPIAVGAYIDPEARLQTIYRDDPDRYMPERRFILKRFHDGFELYLAGYPPRDERRPPEDALEVRVSVVIDYRFVG